ncbi:MAG TPA: hypothetical protein VJ873_10770, partial [bacterium]|nr:hypothetical protein [bacterium]
SEIQCPAGSLSCFNFCTNGFFTTVTLSLKGRGNLQKLVDVIINEGFAGPPQDFSKTGASVNIALEKMVLRAEF